MRGLALCSVLRWAAVGATMPRACAPPPLTSAGLPSWQVRTLCAAQRTLSWPQLGSRTRPKWICRG
eukprot:8865726-Alexandrium_andersonii.AAC.1